jgi:hypothetical protein
MAVMILAWKKCSAQPAGLSNAPASKIDTRPIKFCIGCNVMIGRMRELMLEIVDYAHTKAPVGKSLWFLFSVVH